MEVNRQLVEQISNARRVIMSVENEFYAYRRARSNLRDAENCKRSFLAWFGIVFCCAYAAMVPTFIISVLVGIFTDKIGIFASPLYLIMFGFCVYGWVQYQKRKRVAKYTNEMNEIRGVIEQQFEQYDYIMDVIPKDYRSPEAIKILSQLVESGRALTMQEALNLTEEEFHRRKVERANGAQMDRLDDIYEAVLWS